MKRKPKLDGSPISGDFRRVVHVNAGYCTSQIRGACEVCRWIRTTRISSFPCYAYTPDSPARTRATDKGLCLNIYLAPVYNQNEHARDITKCQTLLQTLMHCFVHSQGEKFHYNFSQTFGLVPCACPNIC